MPDLTGLEHAVPVDVTGEQREYEVVAGIVRRAPVVDERDAVQRAGAVDEADVERPQDRRADPHVHGGGRVVGILAVGPLGDRDAGVRADVMGRVGVGDGDADAGDRAGDGGDVHIPVLGQDDAIVHDPCGRVAPHLTAVEQAVAVEVADVEPGGVRHFERIEVVALVVRRAVVVDDAHDGDRRHAVVVDEVGPHERCPDDEHPAGRRIGVLDGRGRGRVGGVDGLLDADDGGRREVVRRVGVDGGLARGGEGHPDRGDVAVRPGDGDPAAW